MKYFFLFSIEFKQIFSILIFILLGALSFHTPLVILNVKLYFSLRTTSIIRASQYTLKVSLKIMLFFLSEID